ncbi:MAG: dUTP diphosphatase [Clostridiales bacterium]|nr:dUTP diphosphatase [Clostridiales bacterium]
MNLSIKLLRNGAKAPTRATKDSAGYDIYACLDSDVTIAPGQIMLIPSGISIAPSSGDVAILIYARSSLASKHGIALANSVGVIDADYRGEIKIPLINLGQLPYTISASQRIAQLVVTPILHPQIDIVDELPKTARGEGGFGSTGKL